MRRNRLVAHLATAVNQADLRPPDFARLEDAVDLLVRINEIWLP